MANHMFAGSSIGSIAGGTFINNNSEKSVFFVNNNSEKSGDFQREIIQVRMSTELGGAALDKLSAAAAHSALHDAPARTDETRCHMRTRINVLKNLHDWALGIGGEDEGEGEDIAGIADEDVVNDEDPDNDKDAGSDKNEDSDEDADINEEADANEDAEANEDADGDENTDNDEDNVENASIFWLRGGAGAGKSAVMQTLAERWVARRLALGSFFFSRSDPTRNTAEALIPTLTYQLVQLFPAALEVLDPILNRDPLIVKKSLQVQVRNLLVQPLEHLVQLGLIDDTPQTQRVFLIDGLDECTDPAQQQAIIRAAAAVCHDHRIPVKFLIASRPEHAISTIFRWYAKDYSTLGDISLSEDADAEADIRRFIEDEFLKICLHHPFNEMIPSEWPDLGDVESLVRKSSSHFIYASTAMKYIRSAKENPVRSLRAVLSLQVSRTISPFCELDALYHHILGSAEHLDQVLQILAHCIVTSLKFATSDREQPSRIVCFMVNCSHEDLFVFMADMAPLVSLSCGEYGGLQILHASLDDFLCDQSRSGPLYIETEVYLASNLERYLQLMNHVCHKETINLPEWHMYSAPLIPSDKRSIYCRKT